MRTLLNLLLVVLPVSSAPALTLVDDFSDGDTAGWTEISSLATGGPSIFDASSGSLRLASTGSAQPFTDYVVASLDASFTPGAFTDSAWVFDVDVTDPNATVGLAFRSDGAGGGYGLVLDFRNNRIRLVRSDLGAQTVVIQLPKVLDPNTPYTIRGQAAGAFFRIRAWEVGAAEPTSWDLEGFDSTYTSGGFILTAATAQVGPIDASFDNVFFAPEPSTGLLLGGGLVSFGISARMRRRARSNSPRNRNRPG